MPYPVMLHDLRDYLGKVHSGLGESKQVEVIAEINGLELPLTLDNFTVSAEGRLQITTPLHWPSGRRPLAQEVRP